MRPSQKKFQPRNPSFAESSNNDLTSMAFQLSPDRKKFKEENLDNLYKQAYKPAKYAKALEYRNSRAYMIKLPSGQYKEIQLFEDTQVLQKFGLGPYFFIEMFRRLSWLFFILSILDGFRIYVFAQGKGLADYSLSFSTYLITVSLGNYSENKVTGYDGFIVTILPAVVFVCVWLFYLCWKAHFTTQINLEQESHAMIRPEKFCLQMEGLDKSQTNEDELERFFSSFGPVYEISLVRRFDNKLSYFEDLDELEEQIKEEELQVILGSGDKHHVARLRRQKEKLVEDMKLLTITPQTMSVFVHFQFEKSKVDCEAYFNDHYLFNSCGHACFRDLCCCCVGEPQEKYLFKGGKLLVKNNKVSNPQDINWLSFQLNCCSKFCRIITAIVIILIFLALTCTIIGLCSIYINANSTNCDSVVVPATLTLAQAGTTIEQNCYCNANLIASLTDSSIKAFCNSYTTNILIQQAIQYAVVFTSIITNFIFGIIVDKIINCVRPQSQSNALHYKTLVYTVFLILNTVLLPILIYANIFGFSPTNYVSFVTLISSDVRNFFKVSSLSFYVDFTNVWYRNVSPIFTNFLIIDLISVWIFFIISKCSAHKFTIEEDENRILQKHMNSEITSFEINVFKETASTYMIVFLALFLFSGIPSLIPLAFINLMSRYITIRDLLQSNSRRIQGLGIQFNMLGHTFFPFVVVFGCLFGEWMITGNSLIYDISGVRKILPMAFPFFQGIVYVLTRELYLPFFLILAIAVAGEFFLYQTLIRFCSWLVGLCYDKKAVANPYYSRPFSQYAKTMNRQISYNIRNNDKMRNAILSMEKYILQQAKA